MMVTGNRVNICPMYANEQALFEAFMDHEPQKGEIFRKTIDEWLENNVNTFQKLKEKLTEKEILEQTPNEEEKSDNSLENEVYLNQFSKHEQPFIELILSKNPAYYKIDSEIEDLRVRLNELALAEQYRTYGLYKIKLKREQNHPYL
ncbi:MAG: hypothetical protein HC817_12170 [Saprospiraceae bacterium]|nr:hypothetical protein [Saprospiraceae bacterium]